MGAAWVGDSHAAPPHPLDAAILFAPAGEQGIPAALIPNGNPHVQYELQQLASEFLAKTRT